MAGRNNPEEALFMAGRKDNSSMGSTIITVICRPYPLFKPPSAEAIQENYFSDAQSF